MIGNKSNLHRPLELSSPKIDREGKNPNFMKTDHLSNLVVVRRETTTCNGNTFEAIFFLHLDFDGSGKTAGLTL